MVVTLTSSPALPAMYASVVLERRLNERAPANATAPSALLELPDVRALGESSVVVASSSSFPVEPSGLAFAVVEEVASESAETVVVAALTIAAPAMNARVTTVTLASAIPAPALADSALPFVVAETVFVELIDRSPVTVRRLAPETLAIASLVT